MMSDDLDRAFGEFDGPVPSADFHESLWAEIAASERASLRRWRAAAVLATTALIAAVSAAGVLALGSAGPGIVDETLECPVPVQGGVNVLTLFARPSGVAPTVVDGTRLPNPATVEVDAGRHLLGANGVVHVFETMYIGASPALEHGYTFDHNTCDTARPIALARAGLPSAPGPLISRQCWLGATVRMRLRAKISNGKPVAAWLAIRSGVRLKPVAYVEWTPRRVHAWLAAGCRPYDGP